MDATQIQDLIGWIAGLVGTSAVAIALGIINIVRSGKLLPKELKGVDLENRSKELSLATQYDEIATRAADKAIRVQERLDKLEIDHEVISAKVDTQEKTIAEQSKIIEEQAKRINIQEGEIASLVCELNNYKAYTDALIAQMQEKQIIPVEMKTIELENCEEAKEKVTKKNGKRKTT